MAEPAAAGAVAVVAPDVVSCGSLHPEECAAIARRFGLRLAIVADGAPIPGSFWGAPEAGLIGTMVYVRSDTPAHSLLHELSHFVCMSPRRRESLNTNAGGSVIEECAVCYLQLLLAAQLGGFGFERALEDMDRWGYSFREGSAAAWFAGDGADARDWLLRHGLIAADGSVSWRLRGD